MKVLVVAPHADDETLGAGATIARLTSEGHEVTVAVMTGHGPAPHPLGPPALWEKIRAEAAAAHAVLGVARTLYRELPAVQVAEQSQIELNRVTSEVLAEVQPEVLFVPFLNDLHSDHRALFHSLSVAWRPTSAVGRGLRAVLCYETVSETHWNAPYLESGFLPNVWVPVGEHLRTKLEAFACFESQVQPDPGPRSLSALEALARWRGSQVSTDFAEAFVLVRGLLPLGIE